MALRGDKFIRRLREMVHADVNVTVIVRQPFDDQLEQLQFRLRRRQNFLLQDFLRGFDPGHVRVAKNRQAIRLHF